MERNDNSVWNHRWYSCLHTDPYPPISIIKPRFYGEESIVQACFQPQLIHTNCLNAYAHACSHVKTHVNTHVCAHSMRMPEMHSCLCHVQQMSMHMFIHLPYMPRMPQTCSLHICLLDSDGGNTGARVGVHQCDLCRALHVLRRLPLLLPDSRHVSRYL